MTTTPQPCLVYRHRRHYMAWDTFGRLLPFVTADLHLMLDCLDACGYQQVPPNSVIATAIRSKLLQKLSTK